MIDDSHSTCTGRNNYTQNKFVVHVLVDRVPMVQLGGVLGGWGNHTTTQQLTTYLSHQLHVLTATHALILIDTC